jgi:branched-chain amino acid aminotransferase
MNSFVNFNGSIERSDKPLITVQNRGLRFGDGLFETMRCFDGRLPLLQFHFERLFTGLHSLLFDAPSWLTPAFLTEQITELLRRNDHQKSAKVRLMIFRGEGGLYDTTNSPVNMLIESYSIEKPGKDEGSLLIDIFPHSRKAADAYSSVKSNNFLPYVMGALFAKQNGWDDAVILNTSDRICDATIANIFIIKNNHIVTPALTEGCIAGVMRRFLLEALQTAGYAVQETTVTPAQLYTADEVFLTNAVSGIRTVKKCGQYDLNVALSKNIKDKFLHDF